MGEEKWAGTGATGFAAFSMVCFTIFLSLNEYIPRENTPIFFALMTAGAVAQIVAGIVELRKGLATPGNLLLSFGTMFMLGHALTFLMVGLKIGSPVPLLGYINILLGIFMGVYVIPMLRAPIIVFLIAPIGFFVLTTVGLAEIGFHAFKPVAAFLFGFSTIYGIYMMAVHLGEPAGFHLPVGKPLIPVKLPPK